MRFYEPNVFKIYDSTIHIYNLTWFHNPYPRVSTIYAHVVPRSIPTRLHDTYPSYFHDPYPHGSTIHIHVVPRSIIHIHMAPQFILPRSVLTWFHDPYPHGSTIPTPCDPLTHTYMGRQILISEASVTDELWFTFVCRSTKADDRA